MTGRAGTMATPARSGRALAAVAGQLERGVRHHFGRLPMIVLDERTQVKNAIRRWVHMYGLDGTYRDDKRSCGRDHRELILGVRTGLRRMR
jgi:hypothetical protein